jgi:hypothetical protein
MNNWPEVIRFVVQIFCVAAMFAMGLGITLDDVKAPFRNLLALAIIVVVNNLLVPILGILIVGAATLLQGTALAELAEQIVPLTGGEQIGFLLLFLAAGTVVTPFLAGIAGAPIAFSKGIMVVLAGVSALILPIALALLGQFGGILGSAGNAFPAGSVFVTLLIYQLLPLAVGILIKSQYDVIAQRLRPLIVQFAGLSFLVALAAVVSSSPGLLSLPVQAPVNSVQVGTVEEVSSTLLVSPTLVLSNVHEIIPAEQRAAANTILTLEEEKKWVIFDQATTYLVSVESDDSGSVLVVKQADGSSAAFSIQLAAPSLEDRKAELDAGRFSRSLLREFRDRNVFPEYVGQSVVLEEGAQWALVNPFTTYFAAALPGRQNAMPQLAVSQQLPDPSALLITFLQALESLESLPVLAPIIDLLASVILILLPYAMFVAVTLLLIAIGHAAGTVVRSLVAADGLGIPRSLAITTAVRNVTMVLIIAATHLGWTTGTGYLGLDATGIILGFFVVSLIVAAHQAVQWGEETREVVAVAEAPAPVPSAPQVINV